MKKGFTLIEIAIVLVIIGLLTGGILAAQNMIEAAKMRKMTKEFSAYESAIRIFYATYGSLPGDDNIFTPPGNRNGLMSYGEAGEGVDCNGIYANEESYQVFAHLSQAGLLDKKYETFRPGAYNSIYADCGAGNDENTPLDSDLILPNTDLDDKAAYAYYHKKALIIPSNLDKHFALLFSTNVSIALAIDSKFGGMHVSDYGGRGGYVNARAQPHYCYSTETGDDIFCADKRASLGEFFYVINP